MLNGVSIIRHLGYIPAGQGTNTSRMYPTAKALRVGANRVLLLTFMSQLSVVALAPQGVIKQQVISSLVPWR